MGISVSNCICAEDLDRDDSHVEQNSKLYPNSPKYRKDSLPMAKAERAMKAALLIQNWYRRYRARLEVRRRYTWNIFQSIEYAGEQDQMKLHNFFNALLTHVDQSTERKEIIEAMSPRSSPILSSEEMRRSNNIPNDMDLLQCSVDSSYKGIHIKIPINTQTIHDLIESYRKKRRLHAKYAALLLIEATKLLKKRPSITHASTAISGQITVIGDIHGKLEDLLTILYKNGLPSTDNPYVFNGDFVDRGKKSVEVILLLATLVITYPAEVYLNRGNHEDLIMNARYGFCKEVGRKFKGIHGPIIMRLIEEFYRWLPICTIIDHKVLVVHGGISDSINIDEIANMDREKFLSVLRIPAEGMISDDDVDVDDLSSNSLEKINVINNEWKQILDLLWSDPHRANGCVPNSFRGGGSYFGPDITEEFLNKNGLQLLIRSHECKLEGYEFMHDNKCLTIFSASNYYDVGSNRGAYVKLQGSNLEPHFVQYMIDSRSKPTTLKQRVSRMEGFALRELKDQILASKTTLVEGFRERDCNFTGHISVKDWVKIMEEKSHLELPWRVLRDRLVKTNNTTGKVDYMSTFNHEILVHKSPVKGGPTVIEALYRHKSSLETIFRLIDKDNSGFISMDEFSEACSLISQHVDVSIPENDILDLARSIDINKDGYIDFNEFLECFRIVDSQNKSDTNEWENASKNESDSSNSSDSD